MTSTLRFSATAQPKAVPLTYFLDVDAGCHAAACADFLARAAADFSEMVEHAIGLMHLQPGQSALDVGCGSGTALARLAAVVGSSGRVAGVDTSRALIDEARRRLPPGLVTHLQQGSAEALPFPDADFDAVRADRVLLFVPDAARAVQEMARVVRPGGRVVVTETDFGAGVVDASDPATTHTVLAELSAQFPHPWIGRQLRALFQTAGLVEVEVGLQSVVGMNLAEWDRRYGIQDLLHAAVAGGRLSAARSDAWWDDLVLRDAGGRFLASSTFFTVSACRPRAAVVRARACA